MGQPRSSWSPFRVETVSVISYIHLWPFHGYSSHNLTIPSQGGLSGHASPIPSQGGLSGHPSPIPSHRERSSDSYSLPDLNLTPSPSESQHRDEHPSSPLPESRWKPSSPGHRGSSPRQWVLYHMFIFDLFTDIHRTILPFQLEVKEVWVDMPRPLQARLGATGVVVGP
jgi:hypothetical protein